MRFQAICPDGFAYPLTTLKKAKERAQTEVYANRLNPTNGVTVRMQLRELQHIEF